MKKTHDAAGIIALVATIREQANSHIMNLLLKQGIEDILPAHGAVLNALFTFKSMKMNELAEYIERKKNTVTGLITTLENRGYCRRIPDPKDARAQLVVLTEKGEAMRQVQKDVGFELLQLLWKDVPEKEQESCMQTLKKILCNLEQDNSDTI